MDFFEMIIKMLEAGNIESAIACFNEVKEKHPTDAEKILERIKCPSHSRV